MVSFSQLRELKLKLTTDFYRWKQPIINQPEIGLGFITKEFNGILHFLVQAKVNRKC